MAFYRTQGHQSIIPKTDLIKGTPRWYTKTPPAIEPVTVEELQEFGRLDGIQEEATLTGFIIAARDNTEKYLRRALINRTIVLSLDYWPSPFVELHYPPIVSITEIRTVDEDGTPTVYDSANYYFDSVLGRVLIKKNVSGPTNTSREYGGIEIEYVAGYGASRSDIPQLILEGVKLWALSMYENRTMSATPPPSAKNLLYPYRIFRI